MEYTYIGYTDDTQLVKGRISAGGEQAALDSLANIGYRIVSLKPAAAFFSGFNTILRGRVNSSELIVFSRQLAFLLESGVPVVNGFELLGGQTSNRELKKVLIQIVSDIRRGATIAAALSKHLHVFPNLYSKMIAVGEQTGGIEGVLKNLADYIERQAGAMKKLKTALTYPIIVFALGILVSFLLIFVVLPPIVSMFSSLGGELPLPTKILLGSIDFLNSYGLIALSVIAGIGLIGFLYSRTAVGRYFKDKMFLRTPVIGRILLLSELARACRSMSLLLKAGLALPDVMTLTAQTSSNMVISVAFNEVERSILRGEGLKQPLSERAIFPPLMVEMTGVGEETGNIDEVLLIVAQNYDIEADQRIQSFISMIEPAMTIIMGLGVGFLALSIFLPIYSSLSLVD
jgi:type IV pilus assembly protein PilC